MRRNDKLTREKLLVNLSYTNAVSIHWSNSNIELMISIDAQDMKKNPSKYTVVEWQWNSALQDK